MDDAQGIIDGIGCIAEMLSVFYSALIHGGMAEDRAFALTEQMLSLIMEGMLGYEIAEG